MATRQSSNPISLNLAQPFLLPDDALNEILSQWPVNVKDIRL